MYIMEVIQSVEFLGRTKTTSLLLGLWTPPFLGSVMFSCHVAQFWTWAFWSCIGTLLITGKKHLGFPEFAQSSFGVTVCNWFRGKCTSSRNHTQIPPTGYSEPRWAILSLNRKQWILPEWASFVDEETVPPRSPEGGVWANTGFSLSLSLSLSHSLSLSLSLSLTLSLGRNVES